MPQEYTALQFASVLKKRSIAMPLFLNAGLKEMTKLVKKTAKAKIGHYQDAVGDFPAWAQLSPYTMDDKEKQGYVFNADYNPLLRTGEMRDSIEDKVDGLEGVVGSKSKIAAYQEYGTSRIPPRPFIRSAGYQKAKRIAQLSALYAVYCLTGRKPRKLTDE